METNKLKIVLIQKVASCEDVELLQEMERLLFHSENQMKESMSDYKTSEKTFKEELNISEEQQEELDLRYREYLAGKSKSYS